MRRVLYILLLAVLPCVMGQYFEPPPINPDAYVNIKSADARAARASQANTPVGNHTPVPREQTRVAVLGYHNFSETKPVSNMLMRTSEFRRQMQYIRDADLHVISMKEFLDWRLGTLELPAKCVLITLDDGWRSVYTDAYPILREFGYPFTVFLYTKYLSGRGDSMSPDMVREMQAHGATVGSHSTSHLYPNAWKGVEAQGEQAYTELMDTEMGDSQKRLEQLFGPVNTYCYPGGYITPAMVGRLPHYGYAAAFSVVAGKVGCTEDVWQIHRYMVFGDNGSIFEHAMDFGDRPGSSASAGMSARNVPKPPFPVYPLPGSTVPSEVPVISAQLGGMEDVDLNSVRMIVSGFGRVPAKVDSATAAVQWAPPYRLYIPALTVYLSWKTYDGAAHKAEWFFRISQDVPDQN